MLLPALCLPNQIECVTLVTTAVKACVKIRTLFWVLLLNIFDKYLKKLILSFWQPSCNNRACLSLKLQRSTPPDHNYKKGKTR